MNYKPAQQSMQVATNACVTRANDPSGRAITAHRREDSNVSKVRWAVRCFQELARPDARQTTTGILQWVSTFMVLLPNTSVVTRRPP